MAAGKRDQRIKFQQQSRAADGGGGETTTWADVGVVTYAGFEAIPFRNAEVESGEQRDARTFYKVTLPNRRDITAAMRIQWVSNGNAILRIRDMADPGQQSVERALIAELGGPENG
jgi:head-tail adaptor